MRFRPLLPATADDVTQLRVAQSYKLHDNMDYFTDVLDTFLDLDRGGTLAVYGGSESSRISSGIS